MNQLDLQYQNLLKEIIERGSVKKTRNGETLSLFGYTIRHKMSEGFPLLTTKRMAWKQIVTELLWFMRGDTNIKFLVDRDTNIWNGDAYRKFKSATSRDEYKLSYEEFIERIKTDDYFAKKWGDLGPVYGKQWRDLGGYDEVTMTNKRNEDGYLIYEKKHVSGIDQISRVIEELKHNPDSRRMLVNAWNVKELGEMTLPPCHYAFQFYTRELSESELSNYGYASPKRAISLMWQQRSVDTFLGLPFNIASYGLLLQMVADEVGMVPDELIGNLGDTHLYVDHIEPAKQQISRSHFDLPKVSVQDGILSSDISDFKLENYESHPPIKAKLIN